MKSIRLFFAGITLISLAFLASTFTPHKAKATPKTFTTVEYPEAVDARCMDVDYKSKPGGNQSSEGATFVTQPDPDGPTNVHIGLYANRSPMWMKVRTPSVCRLSWI